MKYITFAIMAALILGVAASPAFSNGFAYADEPVVAPVIVVEPEPIVEPESIVTIPVEPEEPESIWAGEPTDCPPDCSKSQLKELQSDESKQQKSDQRQANDIRLAAEPKTIGDTRKKTGLI